MGRRRPLSCVLSGAGALAQTGQPGSRPWPPQQQGFWPSGALSPDNLKKPRPKAAFDLTGTWMVVVDPKTGGAATFRPMPS